MASVVKASFPAVTWWCPQLPPSPKQAMRELTAVISAWPDGDSVQKMAVIGSSLGGFYATWVAEQMACKAVLLNPAVDPARDLSHHIGEQTAWHNPKNKFFFERRFVDELGELNAGTLKAPQNYLAIIAKGDEVLDWREMTARYTGAQMRLLEGSDHALSDFDVHLPAILNFLDLSP